jgi:hypothetical protein
VTRRGLIGRSLLILGINAAGLIGCVLRRPAERSTTRTLSGAELEDLVAFGEALVDGRTLAPRERRYLAEHLEYRTTRSPEYLSLYRTTAGTLEHLAGRRFAHLEMNERMELIARHHLAASGVRPGEDLGQFPDEMRSLRTRAVPDLIGGYYASPAGWAAVGYDTFPGRCGELTRYTRPES